MGLDPIPRDTKYPGFHEKIFWHKLEERDFLYICNAFEKGTNKFST